MGGGWTFLADYGESGRRAVLGSTMFENVAPLPLQLCELPVLVRSHSLELCEPAHQAGQWRADWMFVAESE